ncbi:hypothetical protein DFP72DRAFT_1079289 [Ephemerocybe angulata]|uniref:Uncharacterized protein n=1 Tax=Ephemerocybe angulata TaxID=980116 RepID=A0A8H6HDR4_9AGAR|nr:hypothetical protein DFP72DRAFT_1079289 [Tulosesus angulatus]
MPVAPLAQQNFLIPPALTFINIGSQELWLPCHLTQTPANIPPPPVYPCKAAPSPTPIRYPIPHMQPNNTQPHPLDAPPLLLPAFAALPPLLLPLPLCLLLFLLLLLLPQYILLLHCHSLLLYLPTYLYCYLLLPILHTLSGVL